LGGETHLLNEGDKHQVDLAATRSAIWAGGPPRVAVNVPALCLEGHTSQPLGRYKMYPPGKKNISPQKWHFGDDFPLPKVGYVNSLEGIFFLDAIS